MFAKLLLLFIVVPVIELFLLIEIGRSIGVLPTVGLIIFTGVLVLQPESNRSPDVATLTFWFEAQLGTRKFATHRLYMTGDFCADAAPCDYTWPPTDQTPVRLETWEVAAENRKDRQSGCGAEGTWLDPYVIDVYHE